TDSDNCGACGSRCGAGKTCLAGICTPGCKGKLIYVSADAGNDGNDGCTPATAVKTIGAAIAFATTQDLRAHEIHVCRGTYAERRLILSHSTSLRGGYNCVSWTRAAEFGAAGGFKDPNETSIENGDYTSTISTLEVSGT